MTDQRDQHPIQLRLDEETYGWLKILAKEKGTSRTGYVRMMVREQYRKWEGEKRNKE